MTAPRGALFALFAFAVLPFAASVAEYLSIWSAQPYTHGLPIALASAWLAWRERDVLLAPASWPPMVPVAALVSLVWLVATVADVRSGVLPSVPLLAVLWVFAVFGASAARRLAPIVAIFFIAVPVWNPLSRPLQWMTVAASGGLLGPLGVPATIEGNLVHIEHGTFLVADGCSGLNYFMAGVSVGAVYGQLFVREWRARLAVVGLSALVPIVGNWIRVSSLIAQGQWTRMGSPFIAEPVPHLLYGWAIFALGMVAFFSLAPALERWVVRRWPGEPLPAAGDASGSHLRSESVPRSALPLRTAVLATLGVLLGPAIYWTVGALPARVQAGLPLAPADAAVWEARPDGVASVGWEPRFGGATERIARSWSDGADTVFGQHLVYRAQRQGAEMIGYGNAIAADSLLLAHRLIGQVGPARHLLNEAIVAGEPSEILVWYWYRVGGVDTASPIRAKLLEVPAFFRRATTSELLALSARCVPEDCTGAAEALVRFRGGSRPGI